METIKSRTGSSNKPKNIGRGQANGVIPEAQEPQKGEDDDEDEGLVHRSRLIQ